MIPYQAFNCPHCGAPGHVQYGVAEYSCTCRLTRNVFTPIEWPKCPHCQQPIYHDHTCMSTSSSTGMGKPAGPE